MPSETCNRQVSAYIPLWLARKLTGPGVDECADRQPVIGQWQSELAVESVKEMLIDNLPISAGVYILGKKCIFSNNKMTNQFVNQQNN